jgi:hypothetical protein
VSARSLAAALSTLLLLAAACSSSDSIVRVDIDADPGVTDVVRLHVTLSNGGSAEVRTLPSKNVDAGTLTLPTAFSLTLPKARTGALDLAVDGLDAHGDVIANGDGTVSLNPGDQVSLRITLHPGPSSCGNGTVEDAAGELCDDGDRISSGTCDFRCQPREPGPGPGTGGAGGSGGGTTGMAGSGMGGGGTGGDGSGGSAPAGSGGAGGEAGTGAGGSSGTGGTGPCRVELLTNGNFEAGDTGWTAFTSGRPLIYNYADVDPNLVPVPDSPFYFAWLGYDVVSETVVLRQPIQIPPGTLSLEVSGRLQIWTNEDTSVLYDLAYVELVMNANPYTVYTWSNMDPSDTWMRFAQEIDTSTALAGGSALFQLRVRMDDGTNTNFFFDTLSLVANRCPLSP